MRALDVMRQAYRHVEGRYRVLDLAVTAQNTDGMTQRLDAHPVDGDFAGIDHALHIGDLGQKGRGEWQVAISLIHNKNISCKRPDSIALAAILSKACRSKIGMQPEFSTAGNHGQRKGAPEGAPIIQTR